MDTFKNFAIAQVITPPSPPTTGTSLTLTPGATVYLPAVPFTVAVFDGGAYATATNAELIRVTAIVGDTLTGLIRGYEGSTARTIVAGDYVAQTFTAGFVADVTNSANQSAGTLPDARLSANVPLKNAVNVFTQNQQLVGTAVVLVLTNTGLPLPGTFWMGMDGDSLAFTTFDYGSTSVIVGQVTISHVGVLTAPAGLGATPLNASQLLSGTVPDARLSTNVALKNTDNHFVAQTLASGTIVDDANSLLRFNNPSAPSNARCWRVLNYGDGLLRLEALTDNFAALQSTVNFGRDGSVMAGGPIYERGRPAPMGQWIDVAYSAGNFVANVGTWTVEAGDIAYNRYSLSGTTMIWHLEVSATSLSTAANVLGVSVPTGVIAAVAPTRAARATNNGTLCEVKTVFSGSSVVGFVPVDGTNWAGSTNNTSLSVTIILSLA